jgi:mono/diheme cytochrome c family protein
MKRLTAFFTAAILLGCAASKPRSSTAPMTHGERLYRSNCAACHSLRDPKNYTDDEWELNVRKYGGKLALSEQELQEIMTYLQSAN